MVLSGEDAAGVSGSVFAVWRSRWVRSWKSLRFSGFSGFPALLVALARRVVISASREEEDGTNFWVLLALPPRRSEGVDRNNAAIVVDIIGTAQRS